MPLIQELGIEKKQRGISYCQMITQVKDNSSTSIAELHKHYYITRQAKRA
jgi:hypothetical protein